MIGSRDETAGNQSCQASVEDNGSLTLKLRLPDVLAAESRYVTIPGVRFAYGHEDVVKAILSSQRIQTTSRDGRPVWKRTGTAISYRFLRDGKGWRVFASVDVAPPDRASHRLCGAIGVDINADHLAVAEVDSSGNLMRSWRIDLVTYGKRTEQNRARIGDACVAIAELARAAGKPVVHEALDFATKKAELEATDARYARMLSSLAYGQIMAGLDSACFRRGVETIEVNPAWTSVIGGSTTRSGTGYRYTWAPHVRLPEEVWDFLNARQRAAALCARRRGHVTFALPVRNRAKHVWSHWAGVRKRLRAAHAAHVRSEGVRSCADPHHWPRQRGQWCHPDIRGEIPWRESVISTARVTS
ncbi:hypothetical protein AB4Y32_04900 [Paraburkholderia phymatum]|uniref:Uncharacterized protein n=1 Tax=Paraburkholderia phymatum TaxID=148447 RepID=A0ACC6TV30_9BURK